MSAAPSERSRLLGSEQTFVMKRGSYEGVRYIYLPLRHFAHVLHASNSTALEHTSSVYF